jgi:hypothetical protein
MNTPSAFAMAPPQDTEILWRDTNSAAATDHLSVVTGEPRGGDARWQTARSLSARAGIACIMQIT